MPGFISPGSGRAGVRAPQIPEALAPAQQPASRLPGGRHEGLSALEPRRGPPPATNAAPMAPRTGPPSQPARTPPRTSRPAPEAAVPWSVDDAIREMSALSFERVRRWFKKSASEQYLYAKSLTPEQRGALEQALEQRFRDPSDPQAAAALDMWLSVQQARLRTHTPEQQTAHRWRLLTQSALPAVTGVRAGAAAARLRRNWSDYYASPERPEYSPAFSNFMRIIGDESLNFFTRMLVAHRLAYHAYREGTLAETHASELTVFTWLRVTQRRNIGLLVDEPIPRYVSGALAMAERRRMNGAGPSTLDLDLQQQRKPLGDEIRGWLAAAGQDGLPQAGAFDKEPLAHSFARLLARRRPSEGNSGADAAKVLQDGARVIRAVAEDPELRGRVFAMAENALGTCGDNVAEGFSSIVLAVGRHQMVKAVEHGEVDAASLNRDARQFFRLDVLEQEVHRFIARKLEATEAALLANEQAARRTSGFLAGPRRFHLSNEHAQLKRMKDRLTNEPLEIMLHAKVQLARQLDLPADLPTTMSHQSVSVLTKADLEDIAGAIRTREAKGAALRAFVRSDPEQRWLTAMKDLHAHQLQPIWKDYEDDPVWAEELHPREGESFTDWQTGYERRCHAALNKAEAAELELLFELAGM